MNVENNLSGAPESLPKNYLVVYLAYVDNKPVKTREMLSWPPEPLGYFDYIVRFLARRTCLPQQLLDKVLPVKPNLLETYVVEKLGEKIHDYSGLITGFCYGGRLGNPLKPYQVLLSLSDRYIEDFSENIHSLAKPHPPFDAQDLREAKMRIAALIQHWKKDGYFSDEDLTWIAYVIQHMMRGLDLKHLRYPPKSPFTLSGRYAAVYSSYRADSAQLLAHLWFYLHYGALFSDIIEDGIIKQCPVCAKLFSRPKSEKRYFDRQTYCSERCRKRAEDHRYYERRKEELRLERREDMRSIRKCYKNHGLSYDKKVRRTL